MITEQTFPPAPFVVLRLYTGMQLLSAAGACARRHWRAGGLEYNFHGRTADLNVLKLRSARIQNGLGVLLRAVFDGRRDFHSHLVALEDSFVALDRNLVIAWLQ